METRKKTINGNKWELVNEYWETRNAWGHKTTIIRNGCDWGDYKVRYYNRTWEMYTYQTCMLGAIETIKEEELQRFINDYKYKNNITRFRKNEKQQVIEDFNNTELGIELQELKNSVKEKNFD